METEVKEINVEQEEVKEVSRKTLFDSTFNEVVIKNIWDSHGHYVPWEDNEGKKTRTFKNAKVKLEQVVRSYSFFGGEPVEFTTNELTVNGKEYNAIDIYSAKGSTVKLNVTACLGQG